jgi:hypothetical protein
MQVKEERYLSSTFAVSNSKSDHVTNNFDISLNQIHVHRDCGNTCLRRPYFFLFNEHDVKGLDLVMFENTVKDFSDHDGIGDS